MGIVTQETILFNDTVFNNIAYGMSDCPLEDVVTAARAANADEFIEAMTHGYDTVIGDRGVQLSGGQRQRVLLARALVTDPDLLLLDEPAAGLDQKVEQDFFELLQELNQHITIVLVTHDLGFVAGFVRTVICVHGHVDIHPTSALDGRAISEIYGGEVRMVRHDHRVDH